MHKQQPHTKTTPSTQTLLIPKSKYVESYKSRCSNFHDISVIMDYLSIEELSSMGIKFKSNDFALRVQETHVANKAWTRNNLLLTLKKLVDQSLTNYDDYRVYNVYNNCMSISMLCYILNIESDYPRTNSIDTLVGLEDKLNAVKIMKNAKVFISCVKKSISRPRKATKPKRTPV